MRITAWLAFLVTTLGVCGTATAQVTFDWTRTTTNGSWRTATNWNNQTSTTGTFAGVAPVTGTNGNPGATTDTASFVTPTGNFAVGLNFNGTTNNALNGALELAAITYSGSTGVAGSVFTIGSNAGANGTLTFNGTGVTSNLILSNTTTNATTLRLNPRTDTGTTNVMSVVITNSNGQIQTSAGNAIIIGSNVSGVGGIIKTGDGSLNLAVQRCIR